MTALTTQELQDLLTAKRGHSVTLTLTKAYRVFYAPEAQQSNYPRYTFVGDYAKQYANSHPALGVPQKVTRTRSRDFCLATDDPDAEEATTWIDYPDSGNASLDGVTLTIVQGDPHKIGGITHHLIYHIAKYKARKTKLNNTLQTLAT